MKSQLLSNRYVMAGATFAIAMGIGFVMQRGDPDPMADATGAAKDASQQAGQATATSALVEPLQVRDADTGSVTEAPAKPTPPPDAQELVEIDFTSAPIAPRPAGEPHRLPDPPLRDAAAEMPDSAADSPRPAAEPDIDCKVRLDAETRPAAMVHLALQAPCLPEERVTLHHGGLMFSAVTDEAGLLELDVPAMTASAVFIAAFPAGEGSVAQITVPEAEARDRVALQWRGATGLQLHAFEGGAGFGDTGHVWAEAPRDPETAEDGGFLVRLGDATAPEPRMAEIYTFPAKSPEGGIALTIEAEVTEENCAREVVAETHGRIDGAAAKRHQLTFFMPDCAATGDFLVLKNLYQDLKIAAR
ncbi:translocase [Rhodosalinus halophilus]|uniref:Translocase n=1 Tax=Rhodosalinus halophilus TaxID=2259333 RepID=A0A365U6N4_9RHOB|nr:translocase [Rhodosalinus halophilus]RBI83008.1 translocase [Rhodosalinus halophilus]